jgi:hypothetical protein
MSQRRHRAFFHDASNGGEGNLELTEGEVTG